MALKGTSFAIDSQVGGRISAKLMDVVNRTDKILGPRMNKAVNLIYQVARARRPKVGSAKGAHGRYRVSDPGAKFGVPVKTGALQASIKKKVVNKSVGRWEGEITAGGGGVDYAVHVEFGHMAKNGSHVMPRPFMRPALALNRGQIKKILGEPADLHS